MFGVFSGLVWPLLIYKFIERTRTSLFGIMYLLSLLAGSEECPRERSSRAWPGVHGAGTWLLGDQTDDCGCCLTGFLVSFGKPFCVPLVRAQVASSGLAWMGFTLSLAVTTGSILEGRL